MLSRLATPVLRGKVIMMPMRAHFCLLSLSPTQERLLLIDGREVNFAKPIVTLQGVIVFCFSLSRA